MASPETLDTPPQEEPVAAEHLPATPPADADELTAVELEELEEDVEVVRGFARGLVAHEPLPPEETASVHNVQVLERYVHNGIERGPKLDKVRRLVQVGGPWRERYVEVLRRAAEKQWEQERDAGV